MTEPWSTICEIIRTAGTGFTAISIYIAARVWHTSHQRARRDRAVAILQSYAASQNERWAAATRIVENLDDDTLRLLDAGKPFTLDRKYETLLMAAIPGRLSLSVRRSKSPPAGATFQVDENASFGLRWEVISYLNAVEAVFQSAYSDVAEPTMIIAEMDGLYEPANGRTFCQRFRHTNKFEDNFPYIFYYESQRKQKGAIKPPKPIMS